MPVRIYDLAKKLGIENKQVLAKAKGLGIAAAKVASSSLDKITAQFLEEELAKDYPQPNAPAPVAPVAPLPAAPITFISEPAKEQAPAPKPVETPPLPVSVPPAAAAKPAPMPVEAVAPAPSPAPIAPAVKIAPLPATAPVKTPPAPATSVTPLSAAPVAPASPPVPAPSAAPATPPAPPLSAAPAASPAPAPSAPVVPVVPPPPAPPAPKPVPKIGEKVGFVVLPARPLRQTQDKSAGRGGPAGRAESPRRGDNRGVRGAPPAPSGQRMGQGQRQSKLGLPSAPARPERSLPGADAQVIILKPPVIVRDLADQLKRKPFQIIADLMEVGVFANVNQSIDEDVAQKICAKYNFRFEVEKRERGGGTHTPIKKVELDMEDKPEQMRPRAPVVTIMGHVDHGKTTLLDGIRKSNVAAGEAGGITQHIGAYTISFPHPERKDEIQQITFLDTPGHAAFSAMRARGATVTDIVVLVVAANDGVMPQTLEALSHAQAAKVPIIVAVNKCDHPNANPMKVRQQLQERGLTPDDWGGETIFVDVSALTKKGVDKLLEMILLQADLLELKANPNRRAKGNVIESGLEPGGPTATVLVRKGTLHVGDVVICGPYWGKVRALISEEGSRLKEAIPSVAVKILGLNGVPEAGLEFSVLEDEKNARDLADQRTQDARTLSTENRAKVTLENLFATLDASTAKVLKVVIKADTQGSVEAIVEALKKIEGGQVSLEVIHSAVGTITESDVLLASASSAIILGFHTRIDVGVADLAKREGAQIKLYAIIYELIDQVKEAMAGLLEPDVREVVIGSAEVRKIFELSKGGNVAGCMVSTGRIVRGKARIMRRKGLIYEGVIQTLRRFQDEVNEVRAGMECGIRVEGFNEMQMGDAIECYTTEKVAPKTT